MDTDQLIAHARARFDHDAARKNLREKYQGRLVFGHNGGMFKSTPEMIVFLSLYGDQRIVVQDLYENPIEVNAKDLIDMMQQKWHEQMNAWLVEYNDLSKKR